MYTIIMLNDQLKVKGGGSRFRDGILAVSHLSQNIQGDTMMCPEQSCELHVLINHVSFMSFMSSSIM